jgi:hypothetical protein
VGGVRVRIGVFAHASAGRVGVMVLHPQASGLGWELAGGVVGGLGFSGGETDAVDDGVGVADGAKSVFERRWVPRSSVSLMRRMARR